MPFLYMLLLPRPVCGSSRTSYPLSRPPRISACRGCDALNQVLYGAVSPIPGLTLWDSRGGNEKGTPHYHSYDPLATALLLSPDLMLCWPGGLDCRNGAFAERHNHDSSEQEVRTASQVVTLGASCF